MTRKNDVVTSLILGRHGRTLVGLVSVAVFLTIWQVAGSTNEARASLFSYPTQVLAGFGDLLQTDDLAGNLRITLLELAEGFLPAVLLGIALGTGFATSKRLRYLIEPLFIVLYIAPYVALIPMLTVWFGVGERTKAIVVFISAIVPVAINTRIGVGEISPQWVLALRAFGATRSQIMIKAVLPGALPSIMTGVRLAIGRAIVAAIAAEMYVSINGIGSLVQVYSQSGRTAIILVFVGLISVFGLACVSTVRIAEAKLAPWRERT